MPNWVTNKVKAPKQVIEAMLGENGSVDFRMIIPSLCKNGKDWDGISCAAEELAEIACDIPTSSNPLIAGLQLKNRLRANIENLNDEELAQYHGMMENYQTCGYLHDMDFARKEWGTKWNACYSKVDLDNSEVSFDTAWSCPELIFVALSKKFPESKIRVSFADEDIGSNCGKFTLLDGAFTDYDTAPSYQKQNEYEKKKWRKFACQVKGWNTEDYED